MPFAMEVAGLIFILGVCLVGWHFGRGLQGDWSALRLARRSKYDGVVGVIVLVVVVVFFVLLHALWHQ